MAYVDDLEQDNPEEQSAPNTGAPSQLATPTAAPTANTEKGSGRFNDLNEYLRVNQGQQFGQQVAGKVGEDVAKASQDVTDTGAEYKTRVDAAKTEYNPDLISEASANPEAVAADESKLSDWTKQLNAQYTGPTNLSDTPDLFAKSTGSVEKAATRAKASETEGGRFSLLDTYYGRPNYTQGQKSLDNLLVQNDPNSQQAFEQMRQNSQAVQETARKQAPELREYGASAKGSTEQARTQSRAAIGLDDAGNWLETNPEKTLHDEAAARANLYNQQRDEALGGLKSNFASSQLDDKQLQTLGLQDGAELWGVDPNKYLKGAGDATADTVATKAEVARANALAKLAGLDNNFLPNEELAETYDPNSAVSFDTQGFQSAVSGEKSRIAPLIQERDHSAGVLSQIERKLAEANNEENQFYFVVSPYRAKEFLSDIGPTLGFDWKKLPDNVNPVQVLKDAQSTYSQRLAQANAGIPANYQQTLKRK